MEKIHEKHQCDEQLGEIANGFYQRFRERNINTLQSKKGRKFALNRSDWMHYSYIDDMYTKIYEIFVESGVAHSIENEVAFDKAGNQVEIGSPLQYGLPSNIVIDHPEFLLFIDETGINTNQKDNGQMGGVDCIVSLLCFADYSLLPR